MLYLFEIQWLELFLLFWINVFTLNEQIVFEINSGCQTHSFSSFNCVITNYVGFTVRNGDFYYPILKIASQGNTFVTPNQTGFGKFVVLTNEDLSAVVPPALWVESLPRSLTID